MCKEIEDRLITTEAGVVAEGVQELDIANESGKAAIDAVLDDALIEPLGLPYKILILDECHMATKAAQNRMLKIMEEPPNHLVMILCTTDPEMLLITVRSRCQLRLEVRKPSIDMMANRLLEVCKAEGITTSMDALKLIAKKRDRVPRDSMNLLESVAKNYGKVTVDFVKAETGERDSEVYMDYFRSAKKGLEDILLFNIKLKELDIAPKKFIEGLTRFVLDCLNLKFAINVEEYPVEYVKFVKEVFSGYRAEDLDTLMQIIEHANKMIRWDESAAELCISTTAMRISKLKLLSVGLQRVQEDCKKEISRGDKKHVDMVRQEQNDVKPEKIGIDNALLVSTFGRGVSEVKADIPIVFDTEEKDINNEFMKDGELLELFGHPK